MSAIETYTVNEAAEALKVTPKTVRRMVARGELRAYRVARCIRIKPGDLEKVLKPVKVYAGAGERIG